MGLKFQKIKLLYSPILVDSYESFSNRDCIGIPEAKTTWEEGAKTDCSYYSNCIGILQINAWFYLCQIIIVPHQDQGNHEVLQYPHNRIYQKKKVQGILEYNHKYDFLFKAVKYNPLITFLFQQYQKTFFNIKMA